MARIVNALFIAGLSFDNVSIYPTLFTDGPLAKASISGLSPLTTDTNVVQILTTGGISGASARVSDLRDPLISSTSPTATLQDNVAGYLSAYFTQDPGFANTTRWFISDTKVVTKATTSITLKGATAPTVDQLLYLGNETIRVTAVSTPRLNRNKHVCTVTRGVCGSRAIVHSIDPSTYPSGDDGSRQALTVYSRRMYDGLRQIECALYQFKMSSTNPENIESVLWAWYGYLSDVPKYNSSDHTWNVQVKHFTQALNDHTIRGGEDLDLSHCVVIQNASYTSQEWNDLGVPYDVAFVLTNYEFERLFNIPIRLGQSQNTGTLNQISDIEDLLIQNEKVFFTLCGNVGGYFWEWKVTGINGSAYDEFVYVQATLTSASKDANAIDAPASFEDFEGLTGRQATNAPNAGFTYTITGTKPDVYRVRVEQGETPPKIQCRLQLAPMAFSEAALMLMLSGYGDGSNHSDYDFIPGLRGLQFNPDWINIGSTPANPLTVTQGTQSWLEHLAIDDETYWYILAPKLKLGEWFKNELLLRNMILAFVPSTGKIAARIWCRVDTHTAVNPVSYPATDIDASEVLKEQRVIFLERGINAETLEPTYRKPLQDMDARSNDYSNALTVRIWKTGGAIQDEELQGSYLSNFLRAVFGLGIGSPRVFAIPLPIDSSVTFADLVTWTDPLIPIATGRGFTDRKCIVLGIDPNPKEFIKYAYVVEDLVNLEVDNLTSTNAKIATAFRIKGIVDLNVTNKTATIKVKPLYHLQTWNLTTIDSNLWQDIADEPCEIVIKTLKKHNPLNLVGERKGFREAYFTLESITYDASSRSGFMNIYWTDDQVIDRGLDAEDFIKIGSIVQLPDDRSDTSSPGGLEILPPKFQGYDGGTGSNRIHVNSISRRPDYFQRRYLIGS